MWYQDLLLLLLTLTPPFFIQHNKLDFSAVTFDVVTNQTSLQRSYIFYDPWLFLGKSDEFPHEPLGQELPVLLSPVQPSRGKPSSASSYPRAGLCLHIISHHPDSISPDQSPSKDPRDLDAAGEEAPLPSPDPIIIHSQALLTPDGSPLMGPPPYQPPGNQTAVTVDQTSPADQEREEIQPATANTTGPQAAPQISPTSTDDFSVVGNTDQSSFRVPQTLFAAEAQVASPGSGLAQFDDLSAAERAEDSYVVQLLGQASAQSTHRDQDTCIVRANADFRHFINWAPKPTSPIFSVSICVSVAQIEFAPFTVSRSSFSS